MAGKYEPMTRHLAALAAAGRDALEFDFAEVSDIVGGLPPTAYGTRQWWANSSSAQARSWRDADWHVARVDFERRCVRYERGPVGVGHRERRPTGGATAALGVETDSAELDVRVRMMWQRAGEVTLDGAGALVFPTLPRRPGVYRLSLKEARGQDAPLVYVGETDDLGRRLYGYRRPGAGQQTNLRLHGELRTHLANGGRVTVAVATTATIDTPGTSSPLPLARKTARVLAEHAALALVYLDGNAVVVNRDKGAD